MIGQLGLTAAEHGLCPISVIRLGIRRLLRQRLREQQQAPPVDDFIGHLAASPIAIRPEAPNAQHYEVPAAFFEQVLGPWMKYSSAYWPTGTSSLAEAEVRMLELTCDRAQLTDGQDILELGCGWGSLSLFMAERFPNSRIVAVSNSVSQRDFIEQHRRPNLTVRTADMNDFEAGEEFDRVVSIEMFEHMRNYQHLLRRIAGWLRPGGSLFVHVFCHREFAYSFETRGADDWMGRYFFTGGLMPSLGLIPSFDDHFRLDDQWEVNGTHYQKTAAAWRRNLEAARTELSDTLGQVYGSNARRWFHRWRLFFLACEELFGFAGGTEWLVAHYRLTPQSSSETARAHSGATAAAV